MRPTAARGILKLWERDIHFYDVLGVKPRTDRSEPGKAAQSKPAVTSKTMASEISATARKLRARGRDGFFAGAGGFSQRVLYIGIRREHSGNQTKSHACNSGKEKRKTQDKIVNPNGFICCKSDGRMSSRL